MSSTTLNTPNKTSAPARRPYGWVKWLLLGGAVLALLMSAGGYMLGRSLRPHTILGTEVSPSLSVPDFTMTSSESDQPVSLSDFRGQFVFVYFGYASCPDICPTTLADYTQTYNLLSNSARQNSRFVWITVDPARDNAAVMEEYISHFTPGFMMGLRPPSEETLATVSRTFGAFYEKVNYGSEAGYLMDHSGSVALVDPDGNWRVVYAFNTPPENVAADLEYLVDTELE